MNMQISKVVRFRKGEGRERKKVWRWGGRIIREVKEIRYLGYMFKKNGG